MRLHRRGGSLHRAPMRARCAVGAAALSLPILLSSAVATADDYAGETYSKASEAAKKSKTTLIIAARSGDTLSEDDCIVTRSQSAPFAGADGTAVTGTVQVYLNCNSGYATATKPGPSMGSPEGRAAKAAADAKASGSGAASGG